VPLFETARACTGVLRSIPWAKLDRLETVRFGVIAGAAGGLAEIAWVTVVRARDRRNYCGFGAGRDHGGGNGSPVSAAFGGFGVALHMTLGVSLGIAFPWRTFSYRFRAISPFPIVLAALAGVWVVNFLVVLPIVSPAFVHVIPYSVSLMSKMLFALAAAEVVRPI
jgi:hypothetical protein